MQLFAFTFNVTKSQTLHFYQADFVELQNSKYFKEMKKICYSVWPYPDKTPIAFSPFPAEGCPVTVLGRSGMGHRKALVPKYATCKLRVQRVTTGRQDYTS